MKVVHAGPGTYCPAHLGHVNIAERVAKTVGKVIMVCSVNNGKEQPWFTPEECKAMWQTYDLGENIIVMTFDEFMAQHTADETIVMVRGIRDEKDLEFEKGILEQNRRDYGIEQYHYVIAEERFKKFSSTKARKLAMKGNFKKLARMTNPTIAALMIAKAKQIKRNKAKKAKQ